jgi:8-oxo-dGTP diphosphatase
MKKNPTLLIVVAAALIREDGAVLLQKRPEGKAMAGLWEFPGGKLEESESAEAALCRELDEELSIRVETMELSPSCFASAQLGERPFLLLLYTCKNWSGEPMANEGQQIGWFTLAEMRKLDMPPADLPLLDLLDRLL